MGNNYEKNFSKKQRKILVLGIEKSGKTCFVQCVNGKELNENNYVETNDLDIIDVKKDKFWLQFYDFAGCERKRIFWRHHYIGAQGIVFVVDGSSMESFQDSLDALQQLLKERNLIKVPICVFINKSDIKVEGEIKNKVEDLLKDASIPGENHRIVNNIQGSNKLKQGHQQVIEWLAKTMVEI
ncbi:ADP-ribosylation factor(Arf)/Arf-like (Arl) small GTPase family protein (macronuclear) [Tetrahymena thermophila SB210]|uniref:ADP-ribosylation factor(Arf)/Arf-like (Arl) small GTPase family protein n=1 Tax=Tetrahymena thermophila (strain SB210) TaxID=312017 RepID=Q239C4_TETTS|nr:ADP-ribosylation factor(Arf)/Arf-like (Arl) small GTPase family protein [Tetrahymena thermophila SB210]EAR93046.2 ADP-ribosylation factor(Arf)/Arf-like (Arl) small GTPase family protein [Tetrahymena thermophila SB210]|eukprot:XP_001013291.2 ADP-ribosylation factor(Arf)/Arf-like (Arl) small GTPase family protein [Tetrahymena thermophila SB210]